MPLAETNEDILVDGRTEIVLGPGDHNLKTVSGVRLTVREGMARVGVEGGFDLLYVDGTQTPPFRAELHLNPEGSARLKVRPGERVVFDVVNAA